MKIIKYKKIKNNQYIVTLEDNKEIELYEEVILNNELLIQKEINKTLEEILNENKLYECYYSAIKFLNSKKRSSYEIQVKLQSLGYETKEIQKVIEKIKKQKYIDDYDYALSFVKEKILLTTHGPNRIKNDLRKKGIEEENINDAIIQYNENIQKEKIKKLVNKMEKANQNKGVVYLKRKIYSNLEYQGFSKEIIDEVIESQIFIEDQNIREKEEEKLRKKYQNKYKGVELEYKIKEGLKRKGLLI